MHIENRLLVILREQGKKQSDVTRATLINCSQLSKFASGLNNSAMGIGKAIKIADYLKVPLDYLFCRDEYLNNEVKK